MTTASRNGPQHEAITEGRLKHQALGWLPDVGYSVVYGSDIATDGLAPEHDHYRQVILTGRLRAECSS